VYPGCRSAVNKGDSVVYNAEASGVGYISCEI